MLVTENQIKNATIQSVQTFMNSVESYFPEVDFKTMDLNEFRELENKAIEFVTNLVMTGHTEWKVTARKVLEVQFKVYANNKDEIKNTLVESYKDPVEMCENLEIPYEECSTAWLIELKEI